MNRKIYFEEYSLSNGLHIILAPDVKKPLVTVGVMYKAGSKFDAVGKSGYAHFFEHLLFEGTKNIARGEWFSIVAANGGTNNAFTTKDKTYYYETFPYNHLQLALYLESERMRHPIINQEGINTQKSVVKEEMLQRIFNAPYGKFLYSHSLSPHLFNDHPYQNSVIGNENDLNAATISDITHFNSQYYNPCNATLAVSGGFEVKTAKDYINAYFSSIENKAPEAVISWAKPTLPKAKTVTDTDQNIRIPLKALAFQTQNSNSDDAPVFDLIAALLIGGKSARLHQHLVEKNKIALQVLAFNESLDESGSFTLGALPMEGVSLSTLQEAIQNEIFQLQNKPISQWEFEKLLNQVETDLASSYKTTHNLSLTLASYHSSFNNTNYINQLWKRYNNIKVDDIQRVASTYFKPAHCITLNYMPTEK